MYVPCAFFEMSERKLILGRVWQAVFQTLSTGGVVDGNDEIGKGVLITGKGYPDVATRELVKRLADDLPL